MDPELRKWNQSQRVALAAVFAALIILRLPALTGPPNLSQDATEYIDVARNVAGGEGLTLKIRGYFFGDGFGVPYPAESLRSPLFPLLAGGTYAMIPSRAVFRWFNFVLFLINVALLSAILSQVLPGRIAVYSVLLVGMSEPMFLTSIFPWAEQTALLWLLLALLMACRGLHLRWGAAGAVIEGFVCSLAALSRPEYLLAGFFLLAWLFATKAGKGAIGGFVAGFVFPLTMVSVANLHYHGRTFLPGDYLFHSRRYSAYFSWGKTDKTGTLNFLAGNWLWIIGRTLRNFVNYVAKLAGWKNLFALAAALPLVLQKTVRKEYDWRKRVLVLAAAAFLCTYCLVWAGIDRERYLLPITALWLPFCVYELDRLGNRAQRPWARYACIAVIAANLPLFAANLIHSGIVIQKRQMIGERFYADENPAWSNPDFGRLAAWVRSNVGERNVLCLENPFLINYETGRAAVMLPEQIAPHDFVEFLAEYGVTYWVQNTVHTKRDPHQLAELQRAVERAGATEVGRCGTYQIWRIPRESQSKNL